MTDLEREEFEQQKTVTELQIAHTQRLKELELEVAKLEAKWSSWLKIPIYIIMLPIRILFAFGFIVAMIRKQEPSDRFWDFIK